MLGMFLIAFCVLLHAMGRLKAARILAAPRQQQENEEADGRNGFDGMNYLEKFGYLAESNRETGALRTWQEFELAVRSFQNFANLPPTGKLDQNTLGAMRNPRCGVRDVLGYSSVPAERNGPHISSYKMGPSKWHKRDLTFRIMNTSPDLPFRDLRAAFSRAFRIWSDASTLMFHEIFTGDADIMIKFASGYHADGYPFDGPGIILAHAFFPGDGRGGDMHFDDDESWSAKAQEGIDLFTVAVHELGHSLGLAHSPVMASLMYPWYKGYESTFRLHQDDIDGIQFLYGYRSVQTWSSKPTTLVTRQQERPTKYHHGTITDKKRFIETSPTKSPTSVVTKLMTSPRQTQSWSADKTTERTVVTPKYNAPRADICSSNIDAITLIGDEVYIIKDKWVWRRDQHGVIINLPMNRFWHGLPGDVEKIDAIYERPGDGRFVLFSGNRYWLYNANRLETTHPRDGRPISALGFLNDVSHVDAAFVWGHNRKTYFISGDMYWRYNEQEGRMEHSYPRDMSMWAGVPLPVDAAFKYTDGKTYFFHGTDFYEFNDVSMRVTDSEPQPIGPTWANCKQTNNTPKENPRTNKIVGDNNGCNKTPTLLHWPVVIIVFLFLLDNY